jgi:hypothetical protein
MSYFYTSRGEDFGVSLNGFISRRGVAPSEQWRMRGLVRFNNNGTQAEFLPFPRCFELHHSALRYKNGKPRWFVADYDHGTSRVQMAGISNLGEI